MTLSQKLQQAADMHRNILLYMAEAEALFAKVCPDEDTVFKFAEPVRLDGENLPIVGLCQSYLDPGNWIFLTFVGKPCSGRTSYRGILDEWQHDTAFAYEQIAKVVQAVEQTLQSKETNAPSETPNDWRESMARMEKETSEGHRMVFVAMGGGTVSSIIASDPNTRVHVIDFDEFKNDPEMAAETDSFWGRLVNDHCLKEIS
jgi:hypothetical protein